jgi:hypothetical protein
MTRFEAQTLGLVRDELTINEPGYHVVYSHDYESWSPKASSAPTQTFVDDSEI